MKVALTSLAAVLILGASTINAGVPNTINYQGRLTDAAGAPVPDGALLITFTIYNTVVGGTVLWSSGQQSVTTVDGLFSYELGSNVPLPDLFGNDSLRFLGITVGSNPENSPRTRFTSSGYVFKSQKSNHARNADSLGGWQPSHFLDLATADARYINESRDTLPSTLSLYQADGDLGIVLFPEFGQIETYGTDGQINGRLWDGGWGELQLYDGSSSNDLTAVLTATSNSGGKLTLTDSGGVTSIQLRGGLTGNASVILPDDAVSSSEVLDEPGIATNTSSNNFLLISTMQDILTVQITTPGSGYIMVDGQCYVNISGATGGASAVIQIDEVSGGTQTPPYFNYAGFEVGYSNSGPHIFSMSTSRIYFKPAGTYTFRLEGKRFLTSGVVRANNSRVTAVFYPTAYGSVTAIAEQPGDHPDAMQVTVTDLDGSTHTSYKMDLRYYEEKARQAEIAKQNAELEALQAQTELERARQNGNDR